jgi:hypothetical protein
VSTAVTRIHDFALQRLKNQEECSNQLVLDLAKDMAGYIEDVKQFARLGQLKLAGLR